MDELLLDGRGLVRELRRRGETLVVDGDMAQRLSLAALGLRYEGGAWRITFTRHMFRPHVC